jgi:hypothetical protein
LRHPLQRSHNHRFQAPSIDKYLRIIVDTSPDSCLKLKITGPNQPHQPRRFRVWIRLLADSRTTAPPFGAKDIAIYDLSSKKDGGLRLAIRLDRDDNGQATPTRFPDTDLPTEGLAAEFSYFGANSPGETEAWHSHWQRSKKMLRVE